MAKHTERDCLNQAPRRRWLWPALAIPLLSGGLATGAVALAQPKPSNAQSDSEPQDHYARLLSEVKRDEENARAEIAAAERERSEDDLAAALVRVANSHRLAGESTRQAYLKAADRISDPAQRSRVLRKLLAAAPITEETGEGVIRSAAAVSNGRDLLRVLMYLHEIKESELVRGPLVELYLDAAEKLSSSADLAEALRGLLHPQELDTRAVVRALKIADRLNDDEDRVKVLREVTDHQELTSEVTAAYRKITGAMRSADAKATAADRFDSAMDELGAYRHTTYVAEPNAFAFNFDTRDGEDFKSRLKEMKERMKELKLKMKRDLGSDRFDFQID